MNPIIDMSELPRLKRIWIRVFGYCLDEELGPWVVRIYDYRGQYYIDRVRGR